MSEAARRPSLDAIERMLTSEDEWEYEHDVMCRDLVRYTRDLEAQRNAAVAVLREAQASIRGGLPWSYLGVIRKALAALGADEEATT